MTFSIVARTPDAGLFGVAIASSSPAVAARCAHARAGAGAVATQNITDPPLGSGAFSRAWRRAARRAAALGAALDATPFAAYRQVLVLGARGAAGDPFGRACARRGGAARWVRMRPRRAICWRAPEVPQAMLGAFEAAGGHLGARLLKRIARGRGAAAAKPARFIPRGCWWCATYPGRSSICAWIGAMPIRSTP